MNNLSETQSRVIAYLKEYGESSKKELFESCANYYFQNGMAHFGNILSNMVKNGMIERTSRGRFATKKANEQPVNVGLFSGIE